jgi:hypothetical protein
MNPKKTALVSMLFSRYRVAARVCGGALSLVSTSIALFSATLSASAALLVNEHFDSSTYTYGNDLAGQNGWTGATGYVANNVKVSSTGLTNANVLGATGGSMTGLTTYVNSSLSAQGGTVVGPTVGTASNLGTSTQYWFCALMSLTGDGGANQSYETNFIKMSFDKNDSAVGFTFGLISQGAGGVGTSSGYSFMFGSQYTSSLSTGSVSSAGFTGSQYVGGTTVLIVGRMTVQDANASAGTDAGKEVFDFWLNPTDTTSEATMSSTAQGTMHRSDISVLFGAWGDITLGAQMAGGGISGSMQDEIRVGTSLSDLNLTSIPEVNAYSLIFGCVTLFGACVYRRRS